MIPTSESLQASGKIALKQVRQIQGKGLGHWTKGMRLVEE